MQSFLRSMHILWGCCDLCHKQVCIKYVLLLNVLNMVQVQWTRQIDIIECDSFAILVGIETSLESIKKFIVLFK